MRKYICFLLTFMVLLNPVSIRAQGILSFTDLNSTHWAYAEIIYLAERDIIRGFPDHTFRPEEPVTREHFASLLVNIFEAPSETVAIFNDVPVSHWSNAAIATAVERGIIIQEGMSLGASEPISREEAAVWVVRALNLEGDSIVHEWSAAVATATAIGLLFGMADNLQAPATRAHAAVLLERMLRLFIHELTITGEAIATQTFNIPSGQRLFDHLPEPQREGYHFVGWYLSDTMRVNPNTLIEEALTVVARWNRINSNITIVGDGIDEQTIVAPNGYLFYSYLPALHRRGYAFEGWYLSGTERVTADTVIQDHTTLIVQWDRIEFNLIPFLLLLLLSLLVLLLGILFIKKLFLHQQRKSEYLAATVSGVFTVLFVAAFWTLLTEYISPIWIAPLNLARESVFSVYFMDSVGVFALYGGLLLPIIMNILMAAVLPVKFVPPSSIFGKENQYLIHLLITLVGLLWPIILWIFYGAGISILWLVGYALIVYAVTFLLAAFLFKQGNSQACKRFFFDL